MNKYQFVSQTLSEHIASGRYKSGDILPSENDLAEQFSTSRETIRKALQELAQTGKIQKVKGKGSVVLDVERFNFPVSGLVSFQELQQSLGEDVRTKVVELSLGAPTPSIQKELKLPKGEDVWKVCRTRQIQGECIILDKDYFRSSLVPKLTKEICESSIYQYLEKELDLTISFAKKIIIVEEATDEDRELLDLKGFTHVVVVQNFVHLEDATLFQYTESRHRLDKFRFVDFARRQHGIIKP